MDIDLEEYSLASLENLDGNFSHSFYGPQGLYVTMLLPMFIATYQSQLDDQKGAEVLEAVDFKADLNYSYLGGGHESKEFAITVAETVAYSRFSELELYLRPEMLPAMVTLIKASEQRGGRLRKLKLSLDDVLTETTKNYIKVRRTTMG